jgi:hypothetical protein
MRPLSLLLALSCAPAEGPTLCPTVICASPTDTQVPDLTDDTAPPDETAAPDDTAAHTGETGDSADTGEEVDPWDPDAPLEICINELMPANTSLREDETGVVKDWIELHNPGDTDISLAGWTLTDDRADPEKSPLDPSLTLPAGDFLLLWADNDPTLGVYHLDFSLPADGGELGLYAPDGRGSLVAYGATGDDVALYRITDCCTGAGCWDAAWAGTPGRTNTPPETTLVPLIAKGSLWRYWDQGTLPAADWAASTYDDSAWPEAVGPFGYGDTHIVTTVSYGSNASAKHLTTWFRQTLDITGVDQLAEVRGGLLRDDGGVVYVNGVEVYRNNMPGGAVLPTTPASSSVTNETTYVSFLIPLSLVVEGPNLIAVEVHQATADSSDLGFDFTLDVEVLIDAG